MLESYRGLPKDAKYLIYSAALPFAAFGMFFTDLSFFLNLNTGLVDSPDGSKTYCYGNLHFCS